MIAHIESCGWTVAEIALKDAIEPLGVKAGKAMPVAYAAVEGRTAGLPLYDSIHLLGRESTLCRLRRARERLGGA